MTITGQLDRKNVSREETYEGIFTDLPAPLEYGQAGFLSPSSWELTITHKTYIAEENTVTRAGYTLKLYAKSPTGAHNTYTAAFSYPHLMVVREHEYGYGFAGRLVEAPADVVEFISGLTDSELAEVFKELS